MARKLVIAYDIKLNKYWELDSISHAVRHFKRKKLCNGTVAAVIAGTYAKTKGMCFCYKCENFAEVIQAKLAVKTKKGEHTKKMILVTDLQGNYIGKYKGIGETARELGVSKTTVSQCANGLRGSTQYVFEFI